MKYLQKAITWLREIIPKMLDDMLFLAGAVCIARGAFLICAPAGWLTLGALFLAGAILWSRGGAR